MDGFNFKLINIRRIIEIILSILSIVAGIFLAYQSAYLIYAYHFTNILFLYMVPMTELVSVLVIGLLLIFSGLFLLLNHRNKTVFYKLTGLFIMLFPFNLNLLDLLRQTWFTNSLWSFVIFPLGLFLYLFIRQGRYKIYEEIFKTLRNDIIKLTFVILTYIIIDTLFSFWSYR